MQKNLVYHCYPVAANPAWKWNLDQLRKRLPLFDGKRVIALALDQSTVGAEEVMEYLPGVEWIVMKNDPSLCESASWVPLWESMRDEPGVTFRGHAKGVTNFEKELTGKFGSITEKGKVRCYQIKSTWKVLPPIPGRMETMRLWADILYRTNLDHWPLVERSLTEKPIAGSLRCNFPFRKSLRHVTGAAREFAKQFWIPWVYLGSFYWARNEDFFRRNWRIVPQQFTGVEIWPSKNYSFKESACLFFPTNKRFPIHRIEYMGILQEKLEKWERHHEMVLLPQ